MNQKNLDYLKDGIKYLGFGEGLNDKLAENVSKQVPQFQLNTTNEYGPHRVNYALEFNKSEQSDMYFFNKYTATLQGKDGDDKSQTFYIKKNSGVTAKEAYNLLSGRAVNKDLTNSEGQPYNAWLQIDWSQKEANGNHKFKVVHQAYGYDLDKVLSKFPIKDLDGAVFKERLLKSLERGNLHEVVFQKGDSAERRLIEANPQFKTLNVYDLSMKKLFIENEKKEAKDMKQEKSEKETLSPNEEEKKEEKKREEQKKEINQGGDDESPNKGKKTFKRPKLSVK
jgi:hypothetical protein